jgi:hypothetical protein
MDGIAGCREKAWRERDVHYPRPKASLGIGLDQPSDVLNKDESKFS